MKRYTRKTAYTALFVSLIAICAQICLPFAVPFTMQTFALFAAFFMLGGDAIVAVAVYIAIGAAGVPVFSGFAGGIGVLTGPTGGYIFGFLLSALLYAFGIRVSGERPKAKLVCAAVSLSACYLVGSLWYCAVCKVDLLASAAIGVLPYVLPDALKLALAYRLSKRLLPLINTE